jgi:hypothetical protein
MASTPNREEPYLSWVISKEKTRSRILVLRVFHGGPKFPLIELFSSFTTPLLSVSSGL